MSAAVSDGGLLAGRVRYAQRLDGYRTGIEPALLAASVAAVAGERVLEGGTGAGAAMLCLCARVPGVACTGVELDPAMAELARANVAANGFAAASVVAGDLLAMPGAGAFDHAMANPPWHAAGGTRSADGRRELAKRAEAGLLDAWGAALAGQLRPRGTLTLVLPAGLLAAGLGALERAGCGSPAVLPLWPRAGQAARLVLVRALRGGRGPCTVLPGLVLHEGDGYTAQARAVLWDGAALPLSSNPIEVDRPRR